MLKKYNKKKPHPGYYFQHVAYFYMYGGRYGDMGTTGYGDGGTVLLTEKYLRKSNFVS